MTVRTRKRADWAEGESWSAAVQARSQEHHPGRPGDEPELEPTTLTVQDHRLNYVRGNDDSVLLLIHGMAGSLENWREVVAPLAHRHTIIAPDLPGHGASAPSDGDYSLGAFATGLRDLLVALGHERATLVGHSLGGGIAMQFAHQFPEQTERLVLVSSGGLGPEVSPILRAASLPGSGMFLGATAAVSDRIGSALGGGLATLGLRPSADLAEVARGYASLADRKRRAAFLTTLRSVVGARGQRIQAGDRLYMAAGMPVLIVWGSRDPIIPARHAREAHDAIGGSRLVIFDGIGHLPQLEAPGRFVAELERFLRETQPSRLDLDRTSVGPPGGPPD